jgi:hypothetical protein
LERYYRHRREVIILLPNHLSFSSDPNVAQIARLYRPLSATVSEFEDDDDEDDDYGVQLLPTHSTYQHKSKALTDVWDEREELFGIGEWEEGNGEEASASEPQPQPPRIIISHS